MDQHSQVNPSHRGFLAEEMQAPVEFGVACLPDRFCKAWNDRRNRRTTASFSRTLAMIS
jgi:hypothetical protein